MDYKIDITQNVAFIPRSWKKRIKRTGLSQQAFAVKAGVSYNALSMAINSRSDPRLSLILKVEKLLYELTGRKFVRLDCK